MKPSVITQAELAAFEELRASRDQFEELRNSIRNRTLAGAEIEPGTYGVEVVTQKHRSLTADSLRKVIGDSARLILDALPRTTRRQVRVQAAASQQSTPYMAFDPYLNDEDGDQEESPRISLAKLIEQLSLAALLSEEDFEK